MDAVNSLDKLNLIVRGLSPRQRKVLSTLLEATAEYVKEFPETERTKIAQVMTQEADEPE